MTGMRPKREIEKDPKKEPLVKREKGDPHPCMVNPELAITYKKRFGRPPNEGYSDPEVVELGEELLKWMKEVDDNNIEIVHLSEFYSYKKDITTTQWKSLIAQRPIFIPYYEKARAWMSTKIMKNKNLAQSYGNRMLGMYCTEIHNHEEEIKDKELERKKKAIKFEYELKASMKENVDAQIEEQFNSLMKQISGIQRDSPSAVNMASNNNNNEANSK